MGIKQFFKYHFPFIMWMIIIFVQSSFPSIKLPEVEIISVDKIVHMGVYGVLAALCFISLIHINKENTFSLSPFIWTFIITSVYGFSDEFHQYFVPNRDSEFFDWLADVIGALIMLLLIRYFLRHRINFLKKEKT